MGCLDYVRVMFLQYKIQSDVSVRWLIEGKCHCYFIAIIIINFGVFDEA